MLRAVFWDHDATLVDSSDLQWAKYQAVLEEFGVTVLSEWKQQIRHMNTITFGRWLQNEQGAQFPFEDYLKKADAWYAAHIDQIKPRQGVIPVLKMLQDHKIPMAVVSNGRPSSVTGALKAAGLSDYFSFILTADDVVNKKPHPEPYQKAFGRMQGVLRKDLMPSEILAIEDDAKGVTSAAGAGLPVLQWPFSQDQERSPEAAHYAGNGEELLGTISVLMRT